MKFNFFLVGFVVNQFNWGSGNENLGNEVIIIFGIQLYKMEIYKDGCIEDQIQFYILYVLWIKGFFKNFFFFKWIKFIFLMLYCKKV